MKLYGYVGPDDIRKRNEAAPAGDVVVSEQSVRDWMIRTGQRPTHGSLVRATFVVDEAGRLRIADYGTEHVACASGGRVLAAGVAWFAVTKRSISIEQIDNQSTGYCPEPSCWSAVVAALDAAGIAHPGGFTRELIFRKCTACGQRNVVKDDWFRCAVCDAELPLVWNFTP